MQSSTRSLSTISSRTPREREVVSWVTDAIAIVLHGVEETHVFSCGISRADGVLLESALISRDGISFQDTTIAEGRPWKSRESTVIGPKHYIRTATPERINGTPTTVPWCLHEGITALFVQPCYSHGVPRKISCKTSATMTLGWYSHAPPR